MSFAPVIPMGGYVGWQFLQRTLEKQSTAHASAPSSQRDESYFRDQIATVTSAEQLVADHRLLSVALTAFGLQEDLPHRAYIQKVLESDSADPASFVNRLSDKRYKKMAETFRFGDLGAPRTGLPGFADDILNSYRERSFETAVGEQDGSMRLAMALNRDLGGLAAEAKSETTKWLTVVGTPSLRAVFETAFTLPSSFGTMDIDRQVEILQERTQRLTGSDTIAQFADSDTVNQLIQRFFLAEQVQEIRSVAGRSAALSLLQSGQNSLNALLGR
jgi:hypothetical protein